MTEIDFHFNMPDKVGYACRLLRKAVAARGACVVVVAQEPVLSEVDQALWSASPTDFLAHCRTEAPPHVLARSPVVLCADSAEGLPHQQVLLNLGEALPAGFERFERLIEFVGLADEDRLAGRRRWRHYADRGYEIRRHDFKAAA